MREFGKVVPFVLGRPGSHKSELDEVMLDVMKEASASLQPNHTAW